MPRKKKQPKKLSFKQELPPDYLEELAAKGTSTVKLYRRWPSGTRELMCQHPGNMTNCIDTAERNRNGRSEAAMEQEKQDAIYGWDRDSILPNGNFKNVIDAMLDRRKAHAGDGDGMVYNYGEKFIA